MQKFSNLTVISHPLIAHKLTVMRKKSTTTRDFRTLLREISLLMGYELTRELPLVTTRIETPLAIIPDAPILQGKKLVIIPILRAGMAMLDGLLDLVPGARVGHIGMYRDEQTKQAVRYLVKLPDLSERHVIVADPMLATGNSMVAAIGLLKERGVTDNRLVVLSLVAAPEGVKQMLEKHPKIMIYTAALDEKLNENAFIIPGLGDAGDRIFGTK